MGLVGGLMLPHSHRKPAELLARNSSEGSEMSGTSPTFLPSHCLGSPSEQRGDQIKRKCGGMSGEARPGVCSRDLSCLLKRLLKFV